jgi:hypothetical protein
MDPEEVGMAAAEIMDEEIMEADLALVVVQERPLSHFALVTTARVLLTHEHNDSTLPSSICRRLKRLCREASCYQVAFHLIKKRE